MEWMCVLCQDVVSVLVRSCSSKFFSVSLPGATMLMLDLVHAATVVLALPYDYHDFNRYAVITAAYLLEYTCTLDLCNSN